MITVLCGGVGAARFLSGLIRVVPPQEVTAIVNVGDDSIIHGLHISPDLDTITYTLAGSMNTETGWGLRDESWNAMEMLRFYGSANSIDPGSASEGEAAGWFSLGDKDLGTHLYRTSRLDAGLSLSQVTDEITKAWNLGLRLVPATDGDLRTRLIRPDGSELAFQEYFVRERHQSTIASIRFEGADACVPAEGVVDAIGEADSVIIAPSNPLISINPVLAVPGIRDALINARDNVLAISPIVGGKAIKGPAADLMKDLGFQASVVSVAEMYAEYCSTLVIDNADEHLRGQVQGLGINCVVTDTVMSDPDVAADLAQRCLSVGK